MKKRDPMFSALRKVTPGFWVYDPDPMAGVAHANKRSQVFFLTASALGDGRYCFAVINTEDNTTINEATGDLAAAVDFWKATIEEVGEALRMA